ncbi:helix-turn-helix domain-containing protein [Pseudonocardia sp. C8]|uniref:helix-turn-helix domain-containing protein n=1 Tax=Pseudonocardia sp. C8 TaxID=2762759 RepID=UPI00351C5FE8
MSRAQRDPGTDGVRRRRTGSDGESAASAAEELHVAGRKAAEEAWNAQVNALGGFIRSQRQMAKLSLREMAAMTKVSNAYLSQVERGLHQPSLKVLRSIAEALHLNTDQMLSRAGWSIHDDEPAADPAPAADRDAAPPGVEDAIAADPRLSDEQKTALLGVYRSFLRRS